MGDCGAIVAGRAPVAEPHINTAPRPWVGTVTDNGGVNDSIPVARATDHGFAKLMPDVDRKRAWLLTVDGAPQSYVDLDEPTHLEFEYARRLGHVLDTVV